MPYIKEANNLDQKTWFDQPQHGHMVQFYNDNHTLHTSLLQYFTVGLKNNETCIAIATPEVRAKLDQGLSGNGIDISKVRSEKLYITLDAKETLKKFMINDEPNWELFLSTVGLVIKEASSSGHPLRAFGEMVAILWKERNANGVMKLEEYWNDLGKIYSFPLYCAYPLMTFDANHHRNEIQEIHRRHSHSSPVYAAFKPSLQLSPLANV